MYLRKYVIKIIKKAFQIKCVHTEKQFLHSVCSYMRCHCIAFGPFRFHLGNKQMSDIDFFTSELDWFSNVSKDRSIRREEFVNQANQREHSINPVKYFTE